MADEPEPPRRTLAEKIDFLFRTSHPPGRGEWTHKEVADALTARGVQISSVYVWQLRKGRADNPSKRVLEALAAHFGVSAAFLLDESEEYAARVEAELELAAALRDASVRQLALRAHDLSPENLGIIRSFVEQARRVQGLSADVPEESPPAGPTQPPK